MFPMPSWALYWGTREAWQSFEQRRGAGSALGPGGNGLKWGDWRQRGQGRGWGEGQGRGWRLSLLHQSEFLVDQVGYVSCCSQLMFMGQWLRAKDFKFIIPFSPDSKIIVLLLIRTHFTDENTEAQRGNYPRSHSSQGAKWKPDSTTQSFFVLPFLTFSLKV